MSHKKTIEEHQKSGTFKLSRHGGTHAGLALTSLPQPPWQLNNTAEAIYLSEGFELVSQGILKQTDVRLLTLYASELAMYILQMEVVQAKGAIITLDNGISTTSANRKAAESALKNATAIAAQIGISAIGRSRLGIKTALSSQREKSFSILDVIKSGSLPKAKQSSL